jgi:hypothetical protein
MKSCTIVSTTMVALLALSAEPVPAADRSEPIRAEAAKPAMRDVTFDAVKLDMKKGDAFKKSLLTDSVKKLDGKPIRIRGYILPSFQQSGIKQFVLVRDNMECCFGPGAALYDCVMVELDPGKVTEYAVRPIAVEGVFNIRERIGPDDRTIAIYHLQGSAVK